LTGESHHWRENLETASVAIVMALILKYFTLEAFQIPTGSMQPTLMGLNTSGGQGADGVKVFDRILVDKLIPFYRDPQRWEIWVFLYPLDRSSRYIKRIVGMPGEELKIQHGDIFVRNSVKEDFRIVRKPARVQRDMWRRVWSSAEAKTGGEFWDLHGFEENGQRQWISTGSASAEVRRTSYGLSGITDSLYDGYPASIQKYTGRVPGRHTLRDLRLTFDARPTAEHRSLVMHLGYGSDNLRAEISGPSGNGRIRILLNDRELDSREGKLAFGRASTVEFFRADEAVQLSIDGELISRREFVGEAGDAKNSLSLETAGGAITVDNIVVDRDTHYTNQILGDVFNTVQIPEGMYFMLGDNSLQSSDGRFWREVEVTLDQPVNGVKQLIGGSATSGANSQGNPRDFPAPQLGTRLQSIFRDQYGEEYRYAAGRVTRSNLHHFVPREYFLGRAFFVFWPLPPFSPAWRIGLVR
jgi:signal peptidase I